VNAWDDMKGADSLRRNHWAPWSHEWSGCSRWYGLNPLALLNSLTVSGQYQLYAVNLPSLTDASGFPVLIDGHSANNDPTR
jgi:hypothetical protein